MKKATKKGFPSAWWVRSGWHAEPTDEFEVGFDQYSSFSCQTAAVGGSGDQAAGGNCRGWNVAT
jgi:hypothetical protein